MRSWLTYAIMAAFCLIGLRPAGAQPDSTLVVPERLDIVGNRHLSVRQIREIIAAAYGVRQSAGAGLSQSQVAQGLRALLQHYHGDGYLSARIDSLRWPVAASGSVRITVSEGSPYRLRQLAIIGNAALSERQIRREMFVRTGTIFRAAALEADVRAILARYAGSGHLLVTVDVQKAQIDTAEAAVDIVLHIHEGRSVALGRVEISGLTQTRPQVLLRELGLRGEQVLSADKLTRIPDRLRRLPHLQLLQPPTVAFDADSTAVVALDLKENSSSSFNGILGLNPRQGNQGAYLSGQIDLDFANLLGSGRAFQAFWQRRTIDAQSLRLGYEEPWLFDQPISGVVNLEQEVQDTAYVRRVWSLGVRFYPLENLSLAMQIGRESVLPDSAGRALFGLTKSRADRLRIIIRQDSRDHPWNPSRGLMYGTSVDFIRKRIDPLTPEDRLVRAHFERVGLDLVFLRPLFRRQVAMFGLHGRRLSRSDRIAPIDELYRIGGTGDLRGYREDQFLGSQVAWGTLEYRFLIDRDSRLGLFVDGGYIGRRDESGTWQRLYRTGYGFGIRTKTTVGLLGFDYALGRGDGLSRGKVHIRLINTF